MMTMSARPQLSWEITTRTIVYAAIGAALYAAANYTSFVAQIPGTEGVYLRPGYGILTFFGFAFGPWVGLFAGAVGNAVGDQLTGYGLLTSWWWSLANGLVGLIAAFGPVLLSRWMDTLQRRAAAAAVTAVVATVIGYLFIWIELIIQPELGFNTILTAEYLPTVFWNSIAGVILTPILVYAWEPLSQQLGR